MAWGKVAKRYRKVLKSGKKLLGDVGNKIKEAKPKPTIGQKLDRAVSKTKLNYALGKDRLKGVASRNPKKLIGGAMGASYYAGRKSGKKSKPGSKSYKKG